jgi:hypothetical protein
VAEEARKMKITGDEAARSLRELSKYAGTPIDLDHVAPLVQPRSMMPNQAGAQYEPYQIRKDQVEHASPEMLKKLHEMRTPGEAVVVHDQPRDQYYVAVLKYRAERYPLEFFHDAAQPNKRAHLVQKYEQDTKQRAKELESILQQLRARAGLVVDEEKLKESKSEESAS